MKKYLLLLVTLSISHLLAQNTLLFNKKNIQCVDKWIAYPMDKDSTYIFGFMYLDFEAGLTFDYSGKFKIDKKNNFINLNSNKKEFSMKARQQPNNVLLAEIPETALSQLNLKKIPEWLSLYKKNENLPENLYKQGFVYNAYNEFSKALDFLKKAEKIDANLNGLQTEIAFTYNALGDFDNAEKALKIALKNNPKDCYSYKELAYTNIHQKKLVDAEKVFENQKKNCTDYQYNVETPYNLAFSYYQLKDKKNFERWKNETKKLIKSENRYSRNLDAMEAELNKNK